MGQIKFLTTQREISRFFFPKCNSVCDLKMFWGVAGQTHILVHRTEQSTITVANIWKCAKKSIAEEAIY